MSDEAPGELSEGAVRLPSESTRDSAPRITEVDEVVLRHVIDVWTNEDETPKSVAFKPTPKDENHLSTDHGVDAATAFNGYTRRVGHSPNSTWGLGVGAILKCHDDLEVIKDGGTGGLHASHASVVFPGTAASNSALRKVHERIASELKKEALKRKRLHPPVGADASDR